MPPIDVNVATTNPKSTSKILHTARGIQKRTLNLPMRVADTLDLWQSHMARWGHRLPRANRGMNECSRNQFLETIQPPASFFRVAIGARCAVHGLAVDKDSVIPLTSSAATSAQAAAIGVVKLSKFQCQLLHTALADLQTAHAALTLPHDALAQFVEFSSCPSTRSYDLPAVSVNSQWFNTLAPGTRFRKGWLHDRPPVKPELLKRIDHSRNRQPRQGLGSSRDAA